MKLCERQVDGPATTQGSASFIHEPGHAGEQPGPPYLVASMNQGVQVSSPTLPTWWHP